MAQRQIFHCRLTDFFVSVERLNRPELAGMPLLIRDSSVSRAAQVVACSEEARRCGIKAGMSLAAAQAQCPEAIVVTGNYDHYMAYSELVTDLIRSRFPVVEKAAADEYYMELATVLPEAACCNVAEELLQSVLSGYGLPAVVGIAGTKTVAAIAAAGEGVAAVRYVAAATARQFLAALPIRKLPATTSGLHRQLIGMGITHVGRLQQMTAVQVKKMLGLAGLELWQQANGRDTTPVLPLSAGTYLRETYSGPALAGTGNLKKVVADLVDRLAAGLALSGKLCGTMTMTVQAEQELMRWNCTVPYTNVAAQLMEQLSALIERKYKGGFSFGQVVLETGALVTGSYQIDLFSNAITDLNWHQAMQHAGRRIAYPAQLTAIAS